MGAAPVDRQAKQSFRKFGVLYLLTESMALWFGRASVEPQAGSSLQQFPPSVPARVRSSLSIT